MIKAIWLSTAGATVPIITSEAKGDGVVVTWLVQRPLLACPREARNECLEGFYHNNRFTVAFELW
jgi:hypothetical protein